MDRIDTTEDMMMERKIEWTNSTGSLLVATLSVQTSEEIYCDGHATIVPCCKWHEVVEIDGAYAGPPTTIPSRKVGDITVTGRAGKIGIPSEQMEAIEAARTELRTTPKWVAHKEQIARTRAEADQYDRSQAAMPGWCPRCQSCCYGDCTAN